jgi:nitrogen fixation protein NifU and related proteins
MPGTIGKRLKTVSHFPSHSPLQSVPTIAILLQMFTDAVLDHFRNPRNAGELPDADATVEVTNPVCGDILKLAVRLEGNRIIEARFLCRGCTTAIACGSFLTGLLLNQTIAESSSVSPESISNALGGLPSATFHGAQLAADAWLALTRKLSASDR